MVEGSGNKGLSLGARALLGELQAMANAQRACWPSQQTLAKRLGKCVRSIRRYLEELKQSGLLEIKLRGFASSAIYVLLDQTTRTDLSAQGTLVSAQGTDLPHREVPITRTDLSAQRTLVSAQGTDLPHREVPITRTDLSAQRTLVSAERTDLSYRTCIAAAVINNSSSKDSSVGQPALLDPDAILAQCIAWNIPAGQAREYLQSDGDLATQLTMHLVERIAETRLPKIEFPDRYFYKVWKHPTDKGFRCEDGHWQRPPVSKRLQIQQRRKADERARNEADSADLKISATWTAKWNAVWDAQSEKRREQIRQLVREKQALFAQRRPDGRLPDDSYWPFKWACLRMLEKFKKETHFDS